MQRFSKLAQRLGVARCFSSSAALQSAAASGNGIDVTWSDGKKSHFHDVWLLANCQCDECVHSTGQRIGRGSCLGKSASTVSSARATGETVSVQWGLEPSYTTNFDSNWLRRHCYDAEELAASSAQRSALASPVETQLPEIHYDELVGKDSEQGLLRWLSAINSRGLALLRGVPCESDKVGAVARRIGPLSHAIYGDVFDVVSEPEPINIAYTPRGLPLHMDMAYYESPPGIQFLHCLRFDDTVRGGDSTFLDAHAAAEELRARDRAAFDVLARVPATFQKIHAERTNPIRMVYQRPHIGLNAEGGVTSVFWSPPFEGPLRATPQDVEPYYHAYEAFREVLDDEEVQTRHGVRLRLGPGDLVAFNQRRMLHGRDAFTATEGGGRRHLQGCYVQIDDFLNRFRVLEQCYSTSPGAELGCDPALPPSERRSGISSHF